jgi:hypothetical protein
MQIGERMFLIIGSGHLAVRLSQWCALRRRSVLIGLASNLPLDGPLEGCEIIALPSPMPLNSLPLEARKPTAVLLLNPEALADENPLEAIQNHFLSKVTEWT